MPARYPGANTFIERTGLHRDAKLRITVRRNGPRFIGAYSDHTFENNQY